MITYGYVKDYRYTISGTLEVQVRIPSIHGPYNLSDYRGNPVRNYVQDKNLPYYCALLLHHEPVEGEVVALTSIDNSNNNFMVIGQTGGNYDTNRIVGE
jgi:hypothetical protein